MTAVNNPAVATPDRRTLLEAMRLASRAPSVHNTQPWRWVLDGEVLHLYSDPDRLLPNMDPHGRQLVISCGAMLHHVRTAFGARGWHTDTVRVPNPDEPEHLAEIRFRPWDSPPAGLMARAAVMEFRRTDRLPLDPPEDWAELLPRLRMLASPHYVELNALSESVRPRLVTATEQAMALRHHDMMYQAEIGWWTGHSGMPDGVPPEALPSASEAAHVAVGRTFPTPRHSARRSEIEDRARLVVLSTASDTATDWLRTGEALSAVLLECTASGLATCALTHITELASGRHLLIGLTDPNYKPQVMIRIGVSPDRDEPSPTPRRPLADILTTR
ncbi:Putative NAD(P)H nitroreductase acg [Nocardia seriolae]|uniref:NAD(P)H nitroreductase acg n=1 Tax=Nocardia seriolae TaxID=37332 RepID=A0ABC8AVI2_9NOCA|nr:nitroreductase family protein [Nocardia seriolae]APA98401.1 Putative NAD(P)H nitroreductase acg [Nocardia seriolae]